MHNTPDKQKVQVLQWDHLWKTRVSSKGEEKKGTRVTCLPSSVISFTFATDIYWVPTTCQILSYALGTHRWLKRVHTRRLSRLSHIRVFETPWTGTHQDPVSMASPKQEPWSGLSLPPPGDLPDSRVAPMSPAWQVDSSPLSQLESPHDATRESPPRHTKDPAPPTTKMKELSLIELSDLPRAHSYEAYLKPQTMLFLLWQGASQPWL